MDKPYSEACVRNRDPILSLLAPLLEGADSVLEIGSGTGQHAVYFAQAMPHLQWQTADVIENHAGIRAWLADGPDNVHEPLVMDVYEDQPPAAQYDAVYTANTLHIIAEDGGLLLLDHAYRALREGGLLVIYGPFKYDGEYTSESNARFQVWLKQRDLRSGIRDFEAVRAHCESLGFVFVADHDMPANNQLLVFRKAASA